MLLYSSRDLVASSGWLDKKCYYCGKYFNTGDKITLIIPITELKIKYNKLSSNVIMHTDEFKQLVLLYGEEGAIYQLSKHVAPKYTLQLTEQQNINLEAFRKACNFYGFTIETDAMKSETMYKRRLPGKSLTLTYSPLRDKIGLRRRGKSGLLDGLYEQEIIAKVFNKMHEYLGDNKVDNFSANEIIAKSVEEAKQIFK